MMPAASSSHYRLPLSARAIFWIFGLALSIPAFADEGPQDAGQPKAVAQEPSAAPPASTEPDRPADATDPDQWIELFDGQTLDGWIQRGGRAKFFVQRGELVGATRLATADSFLCTEQTYSDFELELEFKIDPLVNSGVQIRSRSDPDHQGGAVYGYQVEIDPSERAWTGGIYDQSRRGWLVTLQKLPEARAAFKPDQWNRLRIIADGPHIATWINDVPAAELEDDLTTSGFIALQVHRTDLAESREVRWRNIRLRPLPSKPAPTEEQ